MSVKVLRDLVSPARFIIQAIDPALGCPVLAALLRVADLTTLRTLLGVNALDDVELRCEYTIGPAELRAITDKYGIQFEPGDRKCRVGRAHWIMDASYLVHTGYELFLMLEGVKPFAKFGIEYPPMAGDFPEEALFEPHVLSGRLVKRVVADKPFAQPIRASNGRIYKGVGQVLYAVPGEEWRFDAWLLVWGQLAHGPWNATLERLEGSLLGYTDEQNDWWIAHRGTPPSAQAAR